jgi:tetratricopeptide (TPR) repeat protein
MATENKLTDLLQAAARLPADSHERAKLLHDAAWECIHPGNFLEAERLLSQAAAIHEPEAESPYRQHTQRVDPFFSEVLCDLGMMQWRLAHYNKAEASYLKALEQRVLLHGEDHPAVAEVRSGLAGVYRYQRYYRKASTQLDAALNIQTRLLGAEHPDVATSLRNQAALLRDQGQLEEVEAIAERAIKIYDNAYGAESPEALSVAKVLDYSYALQGRYFEGVPHSRKTLKSMMRRLGSQHPLVAGCYLTHGHLLRLESLDDSRHCYQRALDIYESTFPEGHPFVAISLRALSTLLTTRSFSSSHFATLPQQTPSTPPSIKPYDQVGMHHDKKRALEIVDRFYETLDPFAHDFVTDLAEYSPPGEAKQLYQRAIAISEVSGAPGSQLANDLMNLAQVYFGEADYPQAEATLRRALLVIEQQVALGVSWVKRVVTLLRDTYEKLGDQERLAEMKARLEAL